MKALEEALDAGYTFIDTAECYTGTRADGSTAYNEELVGQAVKNCRSRVHCSDSGFQKGGAHKGECAGRGYYSDCRRGGADR